MHLNRLAALGSNITFKNHPVPNKTLKLVQIIGFLYCSMAIDFRGILGLIFHFRKRMLFRYRFRSSVETGSVTEIFLIRIRNFTLNMIYNLEYEAKDCLSSHSFHLSVLQGARLPDQTNRIKTYGAYSKILICYTCITTLQLF